MSLATMSFILGGLLVAIAALGGGFEVRELKIPSVGQTSRVICFVVGVIFVGLAIFLTFPPPASSKKAEWLTSRQYQEEFEKRAREGFYPDGIEGRCEDGNEQFRAEWKGLPLGAGFESFHAMTKEAFENKKKENATGYSLGRVNTFKDCSGEDRYQATWLKRN